jgi:hypothetical protein
MSLESVVATAIQVNSNDQTNQSYAADDEPQRFHSLPVIAKAHINDGVMVRNGNPTQSIVDQILR